MDLTATQQAGAVPRLRRFLVPGSVALSLALLLVPVALTPVPPLLDYPNHMARLWLLAGGADEPPLNTVYAADWSAAATNVGTDLLAAALGRLVGFWTMMPLLLGAAVLLPPLGAVLLNRAVFGRWHWWQAGFALLAWSSTLVAGFLNFQVGLGLAFLAAALDPWAARQAGRWGITPVRMGLGAVLIVVHPFAAGLYGVLLAALAYGPERGLCWQRMWRGALAGGLAIGVPALCFALLAPTLPGGHAPPGIYDPWRGYSLVSKAVTLASPLLSYKFLADLGFALAFWALVRPLGRGPGGKSHTGLLLAALGLMVLGAVFPADLGGTATLDWRFPIMAALAGMAAVQPGLRPSLTPQAMAAAMLLLATARTGWIGSIWHEQQADVASMESALAFVPPGAALLPLIPEDAGHHGPPGRSMTVPAPTYRHLAALAVPLRRAFVPTLFTAAGKQPLRVLPPWSEIAVPEGNPAWVSDLLAPDPGSRSPYSIGYVRHWRERFDYVLMLNAQGGADDPGSVPGLTLVADRGFARLYQITKAGAASPAHPVTPPPP